MTAADETIRHGVTAYAKGICKRANGGEACETCRLAWRTYMRARRRGTSRRSRGQFVGVTQGVRVNLTGLGLEIARAAAIREGKTVDDVVEAALRCCGSRLRFKEAQGQ